MRAKRQGWQTMGTTGTCPTADPSFYFTAIDIGTPISTFNVVLDTGSADFWVVDMTCQSSEGCEPNLHRYNATASRTSHTSTTGFHLKYGLGEVQGTMASDVVSVAGYTVSSLAFARAQKLGERTLTAPAAGVMGLGFSTLASVPHTTPFWELLASKGQMEELVFTFRLATDIDWDERHHPLHPGGVWTLGQIDHSQYEGQLSWSPVVSAFGPQGHGFWGVPLNGLKVNGEAIDLGAADTASIDTGMTLLGGPETLVGAMYAKVPGAKRASGKLAQYYTFPCHAQFNLTLVFNHVPYTLTNDSLNLGRVDSGSVDCVGAVFVKPEHDKTPAWVVGDVFLKTVFSAFSYRPPMVGFAPLSKKGTTWPKPSGIDLGMAVSTTGAPHQPVSSVAPLDEQPRRGEPLPSPEILSVPPRMHVRSSAHALTQPMASVCAAVCLALLLVGMEV